MKKQHELSYSEKQLKKFDAYIAKDSQSISNMCEMLKNIHGDEQAIVNGLQDLADVVCLYPPVRCRICSVLVDSQSDQIDTYECNCCHDDIIVCSDCYKRLYTPEMSNFFCYYCTEQRVGREKRKKKRIINGCLKRRTSKELLLSGSVKKIRYAYYPPGSYVKYTS